MIENNFNYDENDEMTDEQYFSEDDGRERTGDDDALMNAADEQPEAPETLGDEEVTDDEYRVSSITDNFLRVECEIKVESSKTPIKFRYRGEELKGIVLQRLNDDNYIFLVKPIGKKAPKNAEKKMKKIYIPDAQLI